MKNLLTLLYFTLLSLTVSAQSATQIVRGRLTEEVKKSPVVGATVLVIMPDGQKPIGAVTDVNGDYKLASVPLGRQTILITTGNQPVRFPASAPRNP